LIRAAEPLEGIERMRRARGTDDDRLIAAGPARLTQAFGLDLRHNRADLGGPELWIEEGEPVRERDVARSPRVGCQTAAPPWDRMPWRFYVAESPFVTPGTKGLAALPAPPSPPAPGPPKPAAARKTRGGNRAAHRR
jgi:DNA-3-methyladenine glycosylase